MKYIEQLNFSFSETERMQKELAACIEGDGFSYNPENGY
jgi:hypothetical protein